MTTNVKEKHTDIIIGCHILSKCTLNDIKFNCNKPQLLEWMKKEKIFAKSDMLSVTKTTTIGYLMKIHLHLVNQNNINIGVLQMVLEDVTINADLIVEHDPKLKTLQTKAMTNGDMFIPEIPPLSSTKQGLVVEPTNK